MIDIYQSTPKAYYNGSRDFQALARVLEMLSNFGKVGAELISNTVFGGIDPTMLTLLSRTLGFESNHHYNESEFKALCSSFVDIMRWKGSRKALEKSVEMFMMANQLPGEYDIYPISTPSGLDRTTWEVRLPAEARNVTLLNDVLSYVLPAGVSYRFVFYEKTTKPESVLVSVGQRNGNEDGPTANFGQVAKKGVNDERPTLEQPIPKEYGITFLGSVAGKDSSSEE